MASRQAMLAGRATQPVATGAAAHLLRRGQVARRRRRVPQQLVAPLPQRLLLGAAGQRPRASTTVWARSKQPDLGAGRMQGATHAQDATRLLLPLPPSKPTLIPPGKCGAPWPGLPAAPLRHGSKARVHLTASTGSAGATQEQASKVEPAPPGNISLLSVRPWLHGDFAR